MKKLLICDDNEKIVDVLTQYAVQEGYSADHAFDGQQALLKVEQNSYDAILLDVMLPVMDGFEVCRQIRKNSQVPIIMVTALSEDSERIMGLDLGADDYVLKPFSPSEVMARLRAIFRRVAFFEETVNPHLIRGSLKMDPDAFKVYISGIRLDLTRKEFEILLLLAIHAEIVFTRTVILDKVWGFDYLGDVRTVDTHIKRLRAKTDRLPHPDWAITTVRGVGYKFEVLHE